MIGKLMIGYLMVRHFIIKGSNMAYNCLSIWIFLYISDKNAISVFPDKITKHLEENPISWFMPATTFETV